MINDKIYNSKFDLIIKDINTKLGLNLKYEQPKFKNGIMKLHNNYKIKSYYEYIDGYFITSEVYDENNKYIGNVVTVTY